MSFVEGGGGGGVKWQIFRKMIPKLKDGMHPRVMSIYFIDSWICNALLKLQSHCTISIHNKIQIAILMNRHSFLLLLLFGQLNSRSMRAGSHHGPWDHIMEDGIFLRSDLMVQHAWSDFFKSIYKAFGPLTRCKPNVDQKEWPCTKSERANFFNICPKRAILEIKFKLDRSPVFFSLRLLFAKKHFVKNLSWRHFFALYMLPFTKIMPKSQLNFPSLWKGCFEFISLNVDCGYYMHKLRAWSGIDHYVLETWEMSHF